jgi:hypothetical protein
VNADTEGQVFRGEPRLTNERSRTCSVDVARAGVSPTFPASRQSTGSSAHTAHVFAPAAGANFRGHADDSAWDAASRANSRNRKPGPAQHASLVIRQGPPGLQI